MRWPREMAITFVLLLTTGCANQGEELYPLAEERTWTYQLSTESAFGSTKNMALTITNMPERELDGKSVIPQRTEAEGQTFFSFVGSDAEGIFILGNQGPNAAEPEIVTPTAYLLRQPYEQGTTWQYQSSGLGSPGGEVPTLQATIESTEETVTVPAGTFSDCLKVVAKGEQRGGFMNQSTIAIEESSWFCPRVGLVRSINKIGNGGYSLQLQSYGGD